MLVLSRKKNEEIVIEGGIIVTVVEIRKNHVRLGFSAPEGIRINRREVQDKINHEQEVHEGNKEV